MSLANRINRLEARSGNTDGRCPFCPPPFVIRYRQDGPNDEPALLSRAGPEPPGPCLRCGQPAEVIEIVVVVVSTREEVKALERRRKAEKEGGTWSA